MSCFPAAEALEASNADVTIGHFDKLNVQSWIPSFRDIKKTGESPV